MIYETYVVDCYFVGFRFFVYVGVCVHTHTISFRMAILYENQFFIALQSCNPHISNFSFHTHTQFDGEKFVDGLLGIGSAGGNSNSQSEGAALASRLEALRKERAKRTPVVSVQQSTVETMPKKTFNHVAPQGARPTSGNNKRRNRRKKGKKGKR